MARPRFTFSTGQGRRIEIGIDSGVTRIVGMVISMTPVAAARATFSCTLCPHSAGAVELTDIEADACTEILVTGFGAPQELAVPASLADAVAMALGASDPKALFAAAPLSVPFYCPDCGRVFCSHHWVSLPLLDDHVLGAGTYATCPEGHTRLIGEPEAGDP
jgi:hypothetical protein